MTVACPDCDRPFGNRSGMRIHYAQTHGHPVPWKDDVTRNGGYYRKQKRRVLERDGHQCRRCGTKSGPKGQYTAIEAHHLVKWESFDDGREGHAVTNLVALYTQCHQQLEDEPFEYQLREIGIGSTSELTINGDSK